jgi:hypothetical protein
VSVHGEYNRALEALRDRLKALVHPRSEAWQAEAEQARVSGDTDLSTSARAARRLIESINEDPIARRVEGLTAPMEHLEAHCRAILGPS